MRAGLFPPIPSETMPRRRDATMTWGLLAVLVLPPLCSAMLLPVTGEEDGSTDDPKTNYWPSEEGSSQLEDTPPLWPIPRMTPMQMPPTGMPGPPGSNMTGGYGNLRTLGGADMPLLPDASYCLMLLSMPMPPPLDQIPSFCRWGLPGPKGERGDRGPPGPPGSAGKRGMMGFKGRPGYTGPPGMKGQKGDLGEKGTAGPPGFTGTKGDRGFKGEKGDQGLLGPPGMQGPQGETGMCPPSCESVQGPPGTQGLSGPAGARGIPGVKGDLGPKGWKGDKGELGIPGKPGMDGHKGDQGEQGVCECTDGRNGSDGQKGEKGNKGFRGDTGSQGIQGPRGFKGNPGDMGLMGPRGPCSPTIQSAFSACINQSFPIPNWPVSFPHVISNQQGHFDPIKGVYTAPVNGTYVFSYHLAVAEKVLVVGLFRNFFSVVITTEGTSRATASQTVVLHLVMGDEVWLQVKSAVTNGMYTDGESSSTFTGYLLYPDSCEMPVFRFKTYRDWNAMRTYNWDGPGTTTPSPP